MAWPEKEDCRNSSSAGYPDMRAQRLCASEMPHPSSFGSMSMVNLWMQCLWPAVGGLAPDEAWRVEQALTNYLEQTWSEPDNGIWEMRGPKRHFTHSKVMAWVAMDRMIKAVENFGLPGPVERWRKVRAQIHDEICHKGFDQERNTFVQYYGGTELDASLLIIPLLGFLPPSDPRIRGTVNAIERDLIADGFVLRYRTKPKIDGLPPGEAAFLPCSFWLADNLTLMGHKEDVRRFFERLLSLSNDVGLLAEEYDPLTK